MLNFLINFFWGFSIFVVIALASLGGMFIIKAWSFAIELRLLEYKSKKKNSASPAVLEKINEEIEESLNKENNIEN